MAANKATELPNQ